MLEIKHYQALFPKLPQASNTLNGATVSKSNGNVSSDLERIQTQMNKLMV